MKKAEVIERYGEEAWEKKLEKQREKRKKEVYIAENGEGAYAQVLEQKRARANAHPEKPKARVQKWRVENPEKAEANNHEIGRKDGKYYEKHLEYNQTGLQGARNKIRSKHGNQYRPFKMIIAPDSQIHHEWVPKTAEYRGVALVEANPHRYGSIDVIVILNGKITLLTEEEVRKGKKNEDEKEI